MKKIILPAVTGIALLLSSCAKDDTNTAKPSKCTTGTIRFTNTSKNPYYIYIDGNVVGLLDGGKFLDEEVNVGSHSVRAKQYSGYILIPTDESNKVSVTGCGSVEFVFP